MSLPVHLWPLTGVVAGARVHLDGPEGRHAAAVRRLRVGEQVELVDGHGARAVATVAAVGRAEVDLTVTSVVQEPAPAPRLVLVQALPKGDRGELAVELATEVGVDEVVPWQASRCITRWQGERGDRALARWRSVAREAGKQSRRAHHPVVTEVVDLAGVEARIAGAALALALHEDADDAMPATGLPAAGEIVLVVGPEGGLDPAELRALVEAGARACRLGPSVLRTSTAGAVAAALLLARTPRWAAPADGSLG